MNAREDGWKISIESYYERDPGRAGKPCSHSTHPRHRKKQRGQRDNPPTAAAEIAHSVCQRLKRTGDDVDLILGDKPKHGTRPAKVDECDQRCGNVDGARKIPARVLDLMTHRGRKLEAGEGEGNRGP